jgi:cytochrome c oxidase subunit 2
LPPVTTRLATSRIRRRAAGVVGALALLALGGCSTQDIPNQIDIPDPTTNTGDRVFHLWQATWIALWVIGGIVWFLIIGAAVFYRKRRDGHVPRQTRYNLPIEVLYTITPLIIISVFLWFTWRDEDEVLKLSDHPNQTVNVVGYQWSWGFNYLDENVYSTGTPSELPVLYLPVDQSVQFVLTSPDVIHSFFIPAFLMKMDDIPGRANRFQVTPNTEGTYRGFCAELCGTYHSQMRFQVEVLSQQEFDAKMQELRAAGQTGVLDTGRANDDAQDQGNIVIGDRS